ncbi:sodium/potassium/calcium exchanger 1 [Hypanus sabinus]|uniref:sodium/potassium/calcium exchanger 1 n=1 Tax=Hypanus sabinus TaxID=79690 RepID=UPI0028C47098|nr:sodium/potassium/calcium exchanger 1 [Hypanus sabinus]
MYPGRRRRLSWSRVVFLLSALTICSLARFPIGTWSDSAPWRAKTGQNLHSYSRRLLQVTGPGSTHTEHPETGSPNTGFPETGNPNTGFPETGNPNTGLPRAGIPNTGLPRAGIPNTGRPETGNPNTGHPETGNPNTGHPETGKPFTRHPGTGRPLSGVLGTRNPNTSFPGQRNPDAEVLGSRYPGSTLTRAPELWPHSTAAPSNQTSTAGRTSGMEGEPTASEKPRLRGCILVGNEIVPAPGTAAPDGVPEGSGEADRDDKSGSSLEPPLGHTKGEYPVDVFSVEERRRGWVLLHVLGMVYMFIALALVCDEFFVPSLGTITESLKISDDVAGATFMAAGGSAPELFTSLIGVFIAHSNVGIGTIVGSAVFNILFVIGMCAVFSREILHLTWWPLFRDVSFYILDLMMLIVFFLDNEIRWWESLCLLAGYLAYVGFMKYNGAIEIWCKRQLTSNTSVVKVMSALHGAKVSGRLPPPPLPERLSLLSQHQPSPLTDNNRLKPKAVLTRGGSTPSLHNSTLRNTIFQLMINTLDPLTEVKFKQKAEVMDSMAKGRIQSRKGKGKTEKTDLPNAVNVQVTPPSEPAATSPPGDKDDANPNQTGEDGGEDGSDGGSDGSDDDDDSDDSDDDSDDEDEDEEDEEESNDEEPLSLQWPETRRKQITYLCLFPIVFPLWLTVPDVRNPASKKYFIGTFLGSILWIGAFSYLMVWWAHQVGETIGISEEIMGLTILAAGTSIPDLITSVIVARKGLGDMAVSSSVGSNIFDITVGLPVPWLLYTIFNYFQPVPVSSNGLFCAIVLLFLMLLFVIISIGLSKWKMNKILGFTMFCLYFMFLIISVMLEDRIIVCPVSI